MGNSIRLKRIKINFAISALVTQLYKYNPAAVHARLQDIFDSLESDSNSMTWLLLVVAQLHPEVRYVGGEVN